MIAFANYCYHAYGMHYNVKLTIQNCVFTYICINPIIGFIP